MLKKIFALSDSGAGDLRKGIIATTIYNILLMVPSGLLLMLVLEMLTGIKTGIFEPDFGVGGFIALSVVMYAVIFLSQWIQYDKTYTVAYEESANRRITLAEKIRKLPLSFFGEKNLADLTTTIMGDCTALERTFSNAIPLMFGTLFMFAISVACLIVIDYRMGLCILIPAPVAAAIVILARKSQKKAEEANIDAKREAYDSVQEFLDNIQEIKAASREEEFIDKIDGKLENVVKCSFRNELAPGAATTTAQFVLRLGLVLVLLFGSRFVAEGTLSIPYFIMYLIIAGRVYDPFNSCFMLMAEIFSAMVSINRTKDIEKLKEQTGSKTIANKGYDIEFSNVEFAYNEEKVLNGVSFVAKQGEVTALVGPSGSGKSTISRLACRFWDTDKGRITLGGVDISTVDQEVLLKNFSVVFQDVLLFDDSVMENIRLGRKDATDEEVIAAAKAACCEEFINKLSNGYETVIGENGSSLSGGERQRISIARAILKDAPIVLLDEATASMDAESENYVQEALSKLLKNKTVIVIAHRMRTIANADKIIVLDEGKVVQEGTADELIRVNGLYSRMVNMQKEA